MAESTRVARLGALEVHLKKSVEITQPIVDEVNQLPTDAPWVVLRYNPNSGKWQNAQTYESFEAADEAFATQTQNNGYEGARRLGVGGRDGNGRVIGP